MLPKINLQKGASSFYESIHIPIGYSIVIVDSLGSWFFLFYLNNIQFTYFDLVGKLIYEKSWICKNEVNQFKVGDLFIQNLLDIEPKLTKLMNRELPMKLTDEDRAEISNSKVCSHCGGEILDSAVRDHGNVP